MRTYEEITRRLQKMVSEGNLKPGDRLPPERQLATMFGVSRNSVREAIKSLEKQGMLNSRPGAGTFIAEDSQAIIAHALEEIFAQERHRLEDIFELRLLLEPQIAHLAAGRIGDPDIEELGRITQAYAQALQEGHAVFDIDQKFHDAIAAATGNNALLLLMEHMQELMRESRDEALQSPQRNREALVAHRRILEALARRDPDAARSAMKDHLEHTRNIVFTPNRGE